MRYGYIPPRGCGPRLRAVASDMPRILVLDDDDLFRHYLTSLLTRAGYQVKALHNGIGVEQAMAREKFHAVVTDLYMPHSDGLETLRLVKRLSPSLPVIGITSGIPDDPCARAMTVLGAEIVLTKPLDEAAFLAALRRVMVRGFSQPG
jgi:two-component system cell cycle response regulator